MAYRVSKLRYTSSPIIKWIRETLAGRELNEQLRFQDLMSPRPGPEANLPPGVHHQLSNNFYYTRDGRREAHPPIQVLLSGQKLLSTGQQPSSTSESKALVDYTKNAPTPGKVYCK